LKEDSVDREVPFTIHFADDNSVAVEFENGFLSLSQDKQLEAIEGFYRKKMSEPLFATDVSRSAAENEMTIILAETILAKLKRGEMIEKDSGIEISLEELMYGGSEV